MYGNTLKRATISRRAALLLLLFTGILNGQNLLAVMDLQNNGNLPQQTINEICDKIGATVAADTTYLQFDRTMIPELLQQLSVDQSAASCSEAQCLSLIGSMIGANTVIGGTIAQTETTTEITLNCVDVAEKKLKNSVSLSTQAPVEVLIDKEIPALAQSLMHPAALPSSVNTQPSATAQTSKTVPPPAPAQPRNLKNILRNPFVYAGVVFVGGAAAGAYYYKYHYKTADATGEPDDIAQPPVESSEVPDDDAPKRTRGGQ